ncbi:Vps51/Vps67-domain-containing protein [Panaeolus papilionaceus]|nr:Vps51/Vps67-domain-containing protein [Panaeolus papilionaceus]
MSHSRNPSASGSSLVPTATVAGTNPSLESGNRRSAPSSPPPQKTRARDLLRKHYGLGVGPPPPKGGAASLQDPMDLNSPAFDAKSYYEQLITTATLPALLKRENELLSEIRQLDSERQSLVYNHHHELIAASDTISAMKTRAESLDSDLDLLRAAFSEISRLTTEVSIETVDPLSDAR